MAALNLQETREAQAAELTVARLASTRLILGLRSRLIAARDRRHTHRKAVAGRDFLPTVTTVQTRAAVQIVVRQLITIQALEFPLQTALTMHRRATLTVETAGLRWICIGLS